MGGLGSGTWHRRDARNTVEDYCDLDVRYLSNENLLLPGRQATLSWTNQRGKIQATVDVLTNMGSVSLKYHYGVGAGIWQHVHETVQLAWTPCTYGGKRPWFVCPGEVVGKPCERRVAILYGPEPRFRCRHCLDLRYVSQREGKRHRAISRIQGIRMKLGGTGNLTQPLPSRPRYMHHRTYQRLVEEETAAWQAYASTGSL